MKLTSEQMEEDWRDVDGEERPSAAHRRKNVPAKGSARFSIKKESEKTNYEEQREGEKGT